MQCLFKQLLNQDINNFTSILAHAGLLSIIFFLYTNVYSRIDRYGNFKLVPSNALNSTS